MEMDRGMRPRSAYRSAPPVMVKVLPDPVWPYANTVELYPSRALDTHPAPMVLNASSCVDFMGMMESNANECCVSELLM